MTSNSCRRLNGKPNNQLWHHDYRCASSWRRFASYSSCGGINGPVKDRPSKSHKKNDFHSYRLRFDFCDNSNGISYDYCFSLRHINFVSINNGARQVSGESIVSSSAIPPCHHLRIHVSNGRCFKKISALTSQFGFENWARDVFFLFDGKRNRKPSRGDVWNPHRLSFRKAQTARSSESRFIPSKSIEW